MANVNDVRDLAGQLETQWAKLDTANEEGQITDADYTAITQYMQYKERRVGSIGTAATYLSRLRTSAERAHKPLVNFDGIADIETLLDTHETNGATTAAALNNYLSALRGFYKWLDGSADADSYRWRHFIENVEPSSRNPGTEPVDPTFVPTDAELVALQEAASHPRDKALVAFLADAGPRITLALQLKRGDVRVNGTEEPTFRPNPEGEGHKKVPDEWYRLHEAQHHLRIWLNNHHPDDHPEAPVFTTLRGYDPANREQGAIHPKTAEAALKKAAQNADIDPERAHPHNFRRAAVTRMRVKHDMSWEAIKLRTGWSDSSLSEMKQFYRRIDNADRLELVGRELGDEPADPETADRQNPTPCVNCGTTLEPQTRYCPDCGTDQQLDESDLANADEELRKLAARFFEFIEVDGDVDERALTGISFSNQDLQELFEDADVSRTESSDARGSNLGVVDTE
jgi:integrase